MKRKLSVWSYLILFLSPILLFQFFMFFAGRGSHRVFWTAQIDALTPARQIDDDLLKAVRRNDLAKARRLIASGANVNCRDRTRYRSCTSSTPRTLFTPLMVACMGSGAGLKPSSPNPKLIQLLLNSGARPNAISTLGVSALYCAAYQDDERAFDLLMSSGADVNAKTSDGKTPLLRACSKGNASIVKKLLDAGAPVNGTNGSPALAEAVYRGHKEVVLLLLNRGAQVNMPRGYSPLLQCHQEDIAKILLDHGADINATNDRGGQTPLHLAAQYGQLSTIKLLLSRGADPTLRTHDGETPLDIAKRYGIRDRTIIHNPDRMSRYKQQLVDARLRMIKILEESAQTARE